MDKLANVSKTLDSNGTVVPIEEMVHRNLTVGIHLKTNKAQWQQIKKAIEYGKENMVEAIK